MKTFYIGVGAVLLSWSSVVSAQWVQDKNSYPGGIDDAAIAFSIGDSVYIGGGSNGSKAFYKFDPSNGSWTPRASLPHPNAFGVGFTIGTKGYMATGQVDPQGSGQAGVSNEMWQYDPATNSWTKKASLPAGVRDAAFAFVVGSKAYLGGGTDAAGFAYNDFYSYDPAADLWDTLNALPDYMYFPATFTIGNYGYVVTGVESGGETSLSWWYDPSADAWNQTAAFPGLPREAAVGFALDGIGYVGMGHTNYTSVFTDFYTYLPSKNLWVPIPSFPATHGRAWAVGTATSNTAVVGLGTYFENDNLIGNSDVWSFETAAAVAENALQNGAHVFPNPASSYISVTVPVAANGTVSIKNSLGSECLKSAIKSGDALNIASLPAGMYEMELVTGDLHYLEHFIKD